MILLYFLDSIAQDGDKIVLIPNDFRGSIRIPSETKKLSSGQWKSLKNAETVAIADDHPTMVKERGIIYNKEYYLSQIDIIKESNSSNYSKIDLRFISNSSLSFCISASTYSLEFLNSLMSFIVISSVFNDII